MTLTGGQSITCQQVKYTATVKNGETGVTIALTYHQCSVKIGAETLPATVTLNDCDAVWHGKEVSSTTFSEGEIDLACPEGKKVEIHIYKKEPHESANELCTYFVAPFTNNKANEFHNVAGSPDGATVTTTATAVAVTRTGSITCGAASETAAYTGSSTLKAYEDKGGSVSNGTVTGLIEGAQVSVTASK